LVLNLFVEGSTFGVGPIGVVQPRGEVTFAGSSSGNPQTFDDLVAQNNSLAGDFLFFNSVTGVYSETIKSNPIHFTFGQPLYIGVELLSSITVDDSRIDHPYGFDATSDFGHTAIVSGLSVYSDPNLNTPVSTFGVTSQSGTDYQSLVPEPNGSIPCVVGLIAIAVFAKSRRRLV
jgi:hypothetical protein